MAGRYSFHFSVLLLLLLPATASFPVSPSSSTSEIRLGHLSYPYAPFSLRARIEPWADLWLTSPLRKRLEGLKKTASMKELEGEFGPAAAALFRLLAHPAVSQVAFASWPSYEVLGVKRPVWMVGFGSDTGFDMGELKRLFLEWSGMTADRIQPRVLRGLEILTLPFTAKHLHLVSDPNHLLFASNLELLQDYLTNTPEDRDGPDWPGEDVLLSWVPIPRPGFDSPAREALKSGLIRWGVTRVEVRAAALHPGLELQLAFLLRDPMPGTMELFPIDPRLLASVPQKSDLLLLGGGIRPSTPSAEGGEPAWQRLASLFSRPFALGVGLGEPVQSSEGVPLFVGGLFREGPDRPTTEGANAGQGDIKGGGAVPPSPVSEDRWKWGDLDLEVYSQDDWVHFTNTRDLVGAGWEKVAKDNLLHPGGRLPLVVGDLSPAIVARSIDAVIRDRKGEGEFDFLWPLVRESLASTEIFLQLTENGPEVTIRSPSAWSPLSFIGALAVILDHYDPEHPEKLLHLWG